MGERYFITGVQLGILHSYLKGNVDILSTKKLLNKVEEDQFIGNMVVKDTPPFISMFPIKIRPELLTFVVEMENILKQNDDKTHWSKSDFGYLHRRLCEENDELAESLSIGEDPFFIVKESADVANFAMMIADNAKRLMNESRADKE